MRLVRQAFDKLPTIQPIATDTNVGDTISRQAAIDMLCSKCTVDKPETCSTIQKGDNWCEEVYILQRVPPAQPTAKWLIHKWGDDAQCSNCGRSFKDVYDMDNYDQYCRHCGTYMKGVRTT